MILADAAALFVGPVYNDGQGGTVMVLIGILAYALQIYYDFSGYSDMAVGLGLLFGFRFPQNFDSPYHAKSITEFWRRWHISLSTWLRDYLYIPMGGSRKGPWRTYINLFVTMLLGGLWHGASWTFVLWGAFHGSPLAVERMLGKRSLFGWGPSWLQQAGTFGLICMGWLLFRCADLEQLGGWLSRLMGGGGSVISASPKSVTRCS